MESLKRVDFVDAKGHDFSLLGIKDSDVLLPAIPGLQENFHKLKDFTFREEEVIITAYPRSGTHLIWEVIGMLKNGSSEYISDEKETDFLEMCHLHDQLNKKDRVINTHLPPELLPVDWENRKCKFVHVFRNPKDVIVSLYNLEASTDFLGRYGGKFSGYFEREMKREVMYGDWITYELKYEQFFKSHTDLQYLVVIYEDLLQDPVKNIKTVSEFLGLSRDDELIASIAEAVSFSKMKTVKSVAQSEFIRSINTDEEYSKLYRKGVSGDWKNWFTVAQNERFDAEIQDRLKHSSLKSMIKWKV